MQTEQILVFMSFIGIAFLCAALIAFAVVVFPFFRKLRILFKTLDKVFVEKGDDPMDGTQYSVFGRTKRIMSRLVDADMFSRLVLVETAPGLERALIDVSSRGQFTFLIEHMRRHPAIDESERVVIDLGANDGFYGSNSFNFSQLGWWTVLIEANPNLETEIRTNAAHDERWLGRDERVIVRMSAVTATQDGPCTLFIQGWRHSGSSLRRNPDTSAHFNVGVRGESVPTLMKGVEQELIGRGATLPRNFGVLSIDIEGLDYEVLVGICNAGYRPRYIISEERDDLTRYEDLLLPLGYQRIGYFDADVIYWLTPNPKSEQA